MRLTSLLAYRQIMAEGLLTRARLEVYEAVCENEPCTSGEAFASVSHGRHPLSQSRARFTELRDLGVIEEVGERECRVSGRRCILWAVTGRLPVEQKSSRPARPSMVELRGALAEISRLIEAQGAEPSADLAALLAWMRHQTGEATCTDPPAPKAASVRQMGLFGG